MESVRNDLGSIPMRRSDVVEGTYEQKNIVSSYLDGWAVYDGTPHHQGPLRHRPPRTLGDVIAANTDIRRGHLAHNVFRTHPSVG